jgi:hypothetical protein
MPEPVVCLDRGDGGRHPTDASQVVANPRISAGSTVVSDWLRLFRCTQNKKHHDDLTKLLPTLDIGSRSNAGRQRQPEAGTQRTLEAVGSTAW